MNKTGVTEPSVKLEVYSVQDCIEKLSQFLKREEWEKAVETSEKITDWIKHMIQMKNNGVFLEIMDGKDVVFQQKER